MLPSFYLNVKWNTSCATMAAACACPLSPWDGVPFLILAIRRVLASALLAAIMRPRSGLLPSPPWCKLAADFYPTVKAVLRHESADLEEDREGLGCNLGQGLIRVERTTWRVPRVTTSCDRGSCYTVMISSQKGLLYHVGLCALIYILG